MNKIWIWILFLVLALALAGCGYRLEVGPQSTTTPPAQPPAAPAEPTPTAMPTATAEPTPAATPLPVEEFRKMWESTPTDNPGPLMRELDTWYDTQAKALQVATWQYGFQKEVGGWTAVPGSIVWTDTKDAWFTTVDGSPLDPGDVVRLRCQGNWCVYAIYDTVVVPTPGRMVILDRWLDPANDLSGW